MQQENPGDEAQRARQTDNSGTEEVPEIIFDKGAPHARRLVLRDQWGGEVRMSTGMFAALAREALSDRFAVMARIANADDDPAPQ